MCIDDDEVGELCGGGIPWEHDEVVGLGSFFFLFCVKICQKETKFSENGILYCKTPFIYIYKSPKRQPKKTSLWGGYHHNYANWLPF